MHPIIEVKELSKEFHTYQHKAGFLNSLKSLFDRRVEIKKAVDQISFNIDKGELVGFLGPNGAGKSTTIKILTGILLPTSGEVTVRGITPYANRKQNSMYIGVVFGQRSQLIWDLSVEDTFVLYKKMYRLSNTDFKRNVDFYIEMLGMEDFLKRPVRQLSLGQKMRANLAVALLHDPEIIYLDEPTIGLDVIAKSKIRDFIRTVNREKDTTVILTTHDMDDVEQICNRLIMIDNGQIIYDGAINNFKEVHGGHHTLIVEFYDENVRIKDSRLILIKEEGARKHYLFNKKEISVAEAITLVTRNHNITDISLKEPEIEETVKKIYERNLIAR